MKILGLNFGHDASAVVLNDGRIEAYVMRERHSRVKRAMTLDAGTIDLALDEANLSIEDIDFCAITSTQMCELMSTSKGRLSVRYETIPQHTAPCTLTDMAEAQGHDPFAYQRGFMADTIWPESGELVPDLLAVVCFPERETHAQEDIFRIGWLDRFIELSEWSELPSRTLREIGKTNFKDVVSSYEVSNGFHVPAVLTLDGHDVPAYAVYHHMAHAASAFYTSGYDRAAILSHDGGEDEPSTYNSGLFFYAQENRIMPIAPHHLMLGQLYEGTGNGIGFDYLGAAGKLMGLAPYGKPKFFDTDFLGNMFDVAERDLAKKTDWYRYCVSSGDYFDYDIECFGDQSRALDPFNRDVAASTQKLFEESILLATETLYKLVRQFSGHVPNLCFVGGVALNCPANTRLYNESAFDNVYVPPWCDDSGIALGAAQHLYHNVFDNPLVERTGDIQSAYLGTKIENDAVREALSEFADQIQFAAHDDLAKLAAEDLSTDRIIAWAEGRSEIGPRALGHRSILADPRNEANWARVNGIKGREGWRPFAPMVLEEEAENWFHGAPIPSPHMLFTATVKSDRLPAITHVDRSARIQTVRPEDGEFHGVLSHFFELTKVPVLLNTSFNGPGEPIVETPEQALQFFCSSDLDVLYLHGYRVTRR